VTAPSVPREVLVAFTHAEVEAIAQEHGIDLLHIKGAALDAELRRPMSEESGGLRTSVDADILVRPTHLALLDRALRAHGWTRLYDFADGSTFEHAATWVTEGLSSLDVHRHFPGIEIDRERAFDLLWANRKDSPVAGVRCSVPDLADQRLIVIIHAARGRSRRDDEDRARAWTTVTEEERDAIEARADELGARVALRAGTGRIETVRGARTYPLWKQLVDSDGSRLSLWWSRVSSAPTLPAAIRTGVRMVLPNTRRMETALGRPPTKGEVARAYGRQARYGARVLRQTVSRRRGR